MTAIAGEHAAIKQELLRALREISALADEVGMSSLANDLNNTRIPKLDEERFALVVLGEFNHGKSTFVNALCGAPILPAGITPTTATINHLVWAVQPRAMAHLTDGTTRDVNPRQLGEWVTIEGKEASHVKYVEVGWPAEILEDKVTLVDTPGVNDINEQRAEITYGYIPRADAVLFLLDGAQVLKQSERAFLEQRILRRSKDKLIFVLGKI
ncbi:MAG TPA: dynamin family protein, partial [Polyangia bacterium]|nr:dynamin family protein [Polyangia bacterium]